MKTKEQKIEAIRQKCIENDQSILDLVFGCKVEVKGLGMCKYIRKSNKGLSEEYIDSNEEKWICAVENETKIIGRDITLEDVLKTLNRKDVYEKIPECLNYYGAVATYYLIDRLWWLGKPLHLQKQETIDYLHNLLIK